VNVVDDEDGPLDAGTSDSWAGYLPGQDLVPAYLASRFAAHYRVIVEVLLAAQETSLTGVPHAEMLLLIRAHLARSLDPDVVDALLADPGFRLDSRLERLHRWGVLTAWQEPARSGEDFLRRRDRYQLTPAAARLHTFWTQEASLDDEAAADLTLAPRAIRDRLATFAGALRDGDSLTAAGEYQQIIALHHAMAAAARVWQRALAHAVSGGPDQDKQDVLWRTLQAYIGMWGDQVDIHTPQIAVLLQELDALLSEPVWRACAAAASDGAADELIDVQVRRWTTTWTALHHWFDGSEGQARRLRRQLRDLVAPWARNMQLLMESGGAVTRRAELLRLAVAIERAPDDGTAWRMWDTATGAFAARHLLLPAPAGEDGSLSWAEAPPAPVTARFREQGTRAAVGRRPAARDFSAGRAAARRARAAALAARSEAEASLRQRSGSRLSTWGRITRPELDLVLELLGAVHRATPGSTRTAVTPDGRWRVSLTRPDDGTRTAVLDGPDGRLLVTDGTFDLEPAR
jgi:uncharacterized protein (TIGR02677 family)